MYYWQNDICERAIFLFIRNMWKSLPAEPGSFPIHSSSIHPAIRIMPSLDDACGRWGRNPDCGKRGGWNGKMALGERENGAPGVQTYNYLVPFKIDAYFYTIFSEEKRNGLFILYN
jgi:hypothetical protein